MTFFIVKPNEPKIEAGSAEFDNILIDFSLDVKKLSVMAILNNIEVDKIVIRSKHLEEKKLDISMMKYFFNLAFNAAIPFFNIFFGGFTYEVPEQIWNVFKVADLSLTYYDQYIQFGASPVFIPPHDRDVTKLMEESVRFLQ